MTASIRELYEISFESDAAASSLVIKAGVENPIRQYQVEMIARNRIERVLSLDVRQKNEQHCFYYNITSKLTLARIFKSGKINRNQFIRMLSDITGAILDCRNYLLNDQCLVLEEDYIYVNPATFELSLVYIPILRPDIDAIKRFREFILNIITVSVDIDYGRGDNFLHRIISFAKSEMFNASEFHSLLQKLLDEGLQEFADTPAAPPVNIQESAVQNSGMAPNPQLQTSFEKYKAPLAAKQATETVRKADKRVLTGTGLWKLLLAAAVQFVFAGLIISFRDALNNLNKDRVTTYVAVAMIVLSLDVLLFRKLFGGGGITIRKNAAKPVLPEPPQKSKKLEVSPVKPLAIPLSDKRGTSSTVIAFVEGEGEAVCGGNETVLLGSSFGEKHAYLQSAKGSREARIVLTQPDFLIGRLQGQVDHVIENNAIGKVHAQIAKRDGNYFLTDLNSRNGTFINDVRIACNREYAIHHNDRIAFANCEYVFVVQETVF